MLLCEVFDRFFPSDLTADHCGDEDGAGRKIVRHRETKRKS